MSEFKGLDARRASQLALQPAGGNEEALKYFEEVVGFAAKHQRSTTVEVLLSNGAFTPEAITYAVTQLAGRGFDVSQDGGVNSLRYVVKFS
ncbi:hypothetical protein VDQ87_06650 [Xanthomonas campestris pv. campestris]|uniref:hypothetical protein n=1 Tax=Xanthomonas campestris TaxID=339 RepID=UPI002AD48484|nr:hypothetical protein [Xanthomonas campestris]MEA0806207.1 hypothetical protein [Xanthomonas campestris pv. campestris]MEB1207223.1 hypothetical protein [Xanthomonas campestris pv. campestris]MEB1288766.1 hypothetical protein [Xanthomonas campestris pv. campestris]MEB1365422.1 hypothetical protein [Xanthomonas campestris pv. campestris]MEB1377672.1 hypothetical protein [Xanthomonas campestris pv. campestris]